jgi:hypothetical protein
MEGVAIAHARPRDVRELGSSYNLEFKAQRRDNVKPLT